MSSGLDLHAIFCGVCEAIQAGHTTFAETSRSLVIHQIQLAGCSPCSDR